MGGTTRGPKTSLCQIRKTLELVKRNLMTFMQSVKISVPAGARRYKGSQLAGCRGLWVTRSGSYPLGKVGGEGSEARSCFSSLARSAPAVLPNVYTVTAMRTCARVERALKGLRQRLRRRPIARFEAACSGLTSLPTFSKMAEHLLSEGYKDASAVTIGGVLGMRYAS